MKKLINAPERVVEEMLRGMAHGGPGGLIRTISEHNVVVRADAPVRDKVALVLGGGSGHEPTHGGYVAEGVSVRRMPYVGDYMTSLEMAGFSITFLKLDKEMKGYLQAPCNVAAGRPF